MPTDQPRPTWRDVTAGSRWKDRDKRMAGRVVEVTTPPTHPGSDVLVRRVLRGRLSTRATWLCAHTLVTRFLPLTTPAPTTEET